MLYLVFGILSPTLLNLLHLVVAIYVVKMKGNAVSLGFTGISMITKSIGMIFLTWFGVAYLNLDYRLYVPLLTFFWFFTHVLEAFAIQHYMQQNESTLIKKVTENFNKTLKSK